MPVELTHLSYEPEGRESAPPLLIAHGLFGQARNFHSLAGQFAKGRRVIALDMRNHGEAPHDPEMNYPAMAADLAAAIRRLTAGPVALLGHSMGGKAAMALALTHPELLAGLIVADIAPISYGHSHLGLVQAMRALDLSQVTRRSDADRALADAVSDPMLRGFLLQSLVLRGGEARWRLNLATLEQRMDALIDWPSTWPESSYGGPALFLRGGASDYVPDDARPRIEALFPRAQIETLPEAAHWLHADKPQAFAASVSDWLAGLD